MGEPTDHSIGDAAWAPSAPAAPPPEPPPVENLLPGYRGFELIARGGDSLVYRAHQDALDRDVAIKVVLLDDPDSIARFRRELEITVRLGRQHPHIMTVLATGTSTGGQPCLVMDYFELGSLHTRLGERGPLPVSEVVAAGSVVADALAFAHAQGVLHRDVKPQNVLVLPTSYVLADFGLARAIDAGHSASLERFSYRHASAQILDGESPTVADDVYSLGSTLFTLLDGRPPFAADDPDEDSALSYLRRARTEPPRPLVRDDLPPQLTRIVMRCLSRQRADRIPTAAELRDALNAVPTESRSWAPDAAPAMQEAAPVEAPPPALAPAPPPAPAPAPPPAPAPAPPPATAVPAQPVVEDPLPEAPAVSALAHLATPSPSVRRDGESTGVRPAEPAPALPPAPPPSRRALYLVIGAALALIAGVLIGVWRVTRNDHDAAPAPRTSPRPTVTIPHTQVIRIEPGSPKASAIIDTTLKPKVTRARRKGGRLELTWTDPSHGRYQFVVCLPRSDASVGVLPPALPAGTTSTVVPNYPKQLHSVVVANIYTNDAGRLVLGPGAPHKISS